MKSGDYYNQPIKRDIPEIRWIENFSRMLDSRFTFPGTKFRFGLDPIIGLIPFAGDLVTFGASALMVVAMARHGASRELVVRMTLNVLLDAIIGAIPIIGRIFDFFMKANQRNVNLLKKHYHEGKYQGSGNRIIFAIVLVCLLAVAAISWLSIKLIAWLWDYLSSL